MTAIGLLLVYRRVTFNWHEKSVKAEIFYFDEESGGLRKSEFQAQLGVSLRIYKTSILKFKVKFGKVNLPFSVDFFC